MPFDATDFHRRDDTGPPPRSCFALDFLKQTALGSVAVFSAGLAGGFVRGLLDASSRLPPPGPLDPMPPISSWPAEIAGGAVFLLAMVGFVWWFVHREMSDL